MIINRWCNALSSIYYRGGKFAGGEGLLLLLVDMLPLVCSSIHAAVTNPFGGLSSMSASLASLSSNTTMLSLSSLTKSISSSRMMPTSLTSLTSHSSQWHQTCWSRTPQSCFFFFLEELHNHACWPYSGNSLDNVSNHLLNSNMCHTIDLIFNVILYHKAGSECMLS